jgi:hypothetical protein
MHGAEVTAVAVSAEHLITGSADSTVKVPPASRRRRRGNALTWPPPPWSGGAGGSIDLGQGPVCVQADDRPRQRGDHHPHQRPHDLHRVRQRHQGIARHAHDTTRTTAHAHAHDAARVGHLWLTPRLRSGTASSTSRRSPLCSPPAAPSHCPTAPVSSLPSTLPCRAVRVVLCCSPCRAVPCGVCRVFERDACVVTGGGDDRTGAQTWTRPCSRRCVPSSSSGP